MKKDEKFSKAFFEQLPPEIIEKITNYLSNQNLANLAWISKSNRTLFSSRLKIRKFLTYVSRSDYASVKTMLEQDKNIGLEKEKLVDSAGRIFNRISGLEYACWALDKQMWELISQYFTPENRKVALNLYEKICQQKINYCFDGKKITEQHYGFEGNLINKLQNISCLFEQRPGCYQATADKLWKQVGLTQKEMPQHMIQEYCAKEPFSLAYSSQYNTQPVAKFFNRNSDKMENWSIQSFQIGIDFTIYRGERCGPESLRTALPIVKRDLKAIKKLCNYLIEQFKQLKEQIKTKEAPKVDLEDCFEMPTL